MIDKQSNHIKQAGEPTNHKNYMQRFYRVNTHASKVIIYIEKSHLHIKQIALNIVQLNFHGTASNFVFLTSHNLWLFAEFEFIH